MLLVTLLAACLLLISALIVWQHAGRSRPTEAVYGVEDAVDFVLTRLDQEVQARLGRGGVRRIIEWEIYYLQGLAQPDRRHPVETVAGDYPPAVEFIGMEIARRHGVEYSPTDIGAVLTVETGYLQSIGAIGDEAGGIAQ